MRFVHCQQVDRPCGDRLEKLRFSKPLRRDIEQPVAAGAHVRLPLLAGGPAQGRIDERCIDAAGAQSIDLVLHQGDQRTEHQRQPLAHQRRNLITDRFTGPRRHDHQRVAAPEQAIHNRRLTATEGGMAEMFLQDLRRVHRCLSRPHQRRTMTKRAVGTARFVTVCRENQFIRPEASWRRARASSNAACVRPLPRRDCDRPRRRP